MSIVLIDNSSHLQNTYEKPNVHRLFISILFIFLFIPAIKNTKNDIIISSLKDKINGGHMTQNNSNILGTEKILKLFITFSIPSLISMTISGVQNIIDGIFLGNYVGANAMASINIASPFMTLVMGGSMIVAVGGSSFMGRTLGEGNEDRAKNAFKTSLFFLLMAGLLIGFFGFAFSRQIAYFLGVNDLLLADTSTYIKILACFVPIITLSLFLGVLSRLIGKPNLYLQSSITSLIVNVGLNYLLINKLHLGTIGAAFATGLCFTASAIILAVPFFKSASILNFKSGSIDFRDMPRLLYNGSSEGISTISTATASFVFNITFMKLAGATGVSAFTAVVYLLTSGNMILFGICSGIGVIISFNYGAKQYDRVKQIIQLALAISGGIGLFLFCLLFFFGKELTGIFISNNPEVQALSIHGAKLFSITFLINGFNIVFSSYFTSVGDAFASIVIALSRGLVFILIGIFVLPSFFGISGVWLSIPFAECITVLIVLFLFYRRKKTEHP